MSDYFQKFSAVCGDIHDERNYGKLPDRTMGYAAAILDVYQTRSLSLRMNVLSPGVMEGQQIFDFVDLQMLIYQTTDASFHHAWRNKIEAPSGVNAHLSEVAGHAKKARVPLVALCTSTPDSMPNYLKSMELADIILVTRTDTSAAVKRHNFPGQLWTPDTISRAVLGGTAIGPHQKIFEPISKTFFSAALKAATRGRQGIPE